MYIISFDPITYIGPDVQAVELDKAHERNKRTQQHFNKTHHVVFPEMSVRDPQGSKTQSKVDLWKTHL